MSFPVDEIIPQLAQALEQSNTVVLSAPPGAGKTTRVPLSLLKDGLSIGSRIVMLEPRRLAARRSAEFMARQLGERTGETVGYRIRGETHCSPGTRIEVLTEGILTRLLHRQPDLPGVGLVIFDEFHERSIHADVGLAFALDVQKHLRPDLRILIMSATLDGLRLSSLLDAPIVESKGRLFPVETRYASFTTDKPVEVRVADVIERALLNEEGDLLVFLPGWREIFKADNELRKRPLGEHVAIHMLHGEAPAASQNAALAPAPPGIRKIILSTNVAETSLTIEGIRVVIDSGLVRVSKFDPARGMSGLHTIPVSKASSDQRRGRAGRLAPGICYRLWTEQEQTQRPDFAQPEIRSADLTPLALDLIRWGDPNGTGLLLLDQPPAGHLKHARALLHNLEFIDDKDRLTPLGAAATDLPVHPRIAHMLLRAKSLGIGSTACLLAAMLEERDGSGGKKNHEVDLTNMWHDVKRASGSVIDRIQKQEIRLRQLLQVTKGGNDDRSLGLLLAFAYPDRIARRKEGNAYVLASGQTALLPRESLLAREEFLAVADADSLGSVTRILLAAPLRKEDLLSHFSSLVVEEDDVRWNGQEEAVTARRVTRIGSVVLFERLISSDDERIAEALADGIRQSGMHILPWSKEALSLIDRSEWLRTRGVIPEEWPDCSEKGLAESLPHWMPFLRGMRQRSQLSRLDMLELVRSRFSYRQLQALERLAPAHLSVPSGSRIALDYSGAVPVLPVRLQELFGLLDTPRIVNGTVPVLIHLLSPARRPVAITQDLPSFWKNVYPEIRTQMRSKYPKHVWPEDPLAAAPTSKTKRGRTIY